MNGIVEKLQAQRGTLVDIVRQIDIAITALGGGIVTPHANGATREHFSKHFTPERKAQWMRNVQRTKNRNKRRARQAAFKREAEAAARAREGQEARPFA